MEGNSELCTAKHKSQYNDSKTDKQNYTENSGREEAHERVTDRHS